MRLLTSLAMAVFVLAVFAGPSYAIPQLINYQGILKDNLGNPVTTSTSVEFRLFDAPVGGTEYWMETQLVDPDNDGLFNVLLGAVNPVPDTALELGNAFLGVTISPDPEMIPRTQLVSVAYAYRPGTVDGASGGNITSKVSIGANHTNAGTDAFVAGESNDASGNWSTIGGGQLNVTSGVHSTIAGGRSGVASAANSAVGGGLGNTASGTIASTVGGGTSNTAAFSWATVSGGHSNQATDSAATVGGGRNNRATGYYSVVAGGGGSQLLDSNAAVGDWSAVGGGRRNSAGGLTSVVAGGSLNDAAGVTSTVGGGVGDSALGAFSCVPGGWYNKALGTGSFAAGMSARAEHDGAMVLVADPSANSLNPVISDTTGQMVLMANRSFCFTNTTGVAPHVAGRFINTVTGAYLTTGGTWTNSSDKNKKENFTNVDRSELLEKIAALNISRWNYKGEEPDAQHIGPTAQEFHALFQVGNDDQTISTIDPAGIALAAIQELDARTKRIEALSRENENLREEMRELRVIVDQLMERLK